MISNAAIKSGFSGGCIVDYPNSALAKKYYLVQSTAHQGKMEIKMVDGLQEGDSDEENDKIRKNNNRYNYKLTLQKEKNKKGAKEWQV